MLSSWSRIQTCTGNVITEGHMCWRTSAEANSDVFLAASTLFQLFALLIKLINIVNQWVLGVQQLSLKFNLMTTRFLIVQNSLPTFEGKLLPSCAEQESLPPNWLKLDLVKYLHLLPGSLPPSSLLSLASERPFDPVGDLRSVFLKSPLIYLLNVSHSFFWSWKFNLFYNYIFLSFHL